MEVSPDLEVSGRHNNLSGLRKNVANITLELPCSLRGTSSQFHKNLGL